ncbi:MAG TPA: hypothetical protein VJV75_13090 [Candidatus Polarisedimenticolia bacterium]|nr:hypothetical protein [Candidatus Polarisedimenticolia bacterium]
MRRRHLVVFVISLLAAGALPALAGGNANFLLGARSAGSEEFWGDEQDQSVAGIMVDFGYEGWPIHLCLSNMDSSSDNEDNDGSISEIAIGVLKVWEGKGTIRPYVGGGVANVIASFSTDVGFGDLVQHDSTGGLYIDAGVFWRTGKRFNVGIGARLMTLADVEIQGVRGDADYTQVHILAGWGWPRRERAAAAPPAGTTP